MNGLLRGAIAGAAGTLALEITSYADMAIRGRASSDLPAEVVRRMAEAIGMDALSASNERAGERTKARRSALGAISGYAVGIGIGVLYGAVRPLLRRVPVAISGVALGAAGMAAADVPAAKLGATDPTTWGVAGWTADALPHAVFGLVTATVASII